MPSFDGHRMPIKINFDSPQFFELNAFSGYSKVCGLYFILLPQRKIAYPFKESRLIYIGMSERVSNSIQSRLAEHFDGRSGNAGLKNYRASDGLRFVCLNYEALRPFWRQRIEDLESYFILDFVKHFGIYPICNNKSTFPEFGQATTEVLDISWDYFG